jgi:hypothetical protein
MRAVVGDLREYILLASVVGARERRSAVWVAGEVWLGRPYLHNGFFLRSLRAPWSNPSFALASLAQVR